MIPRRVGVVFVVATVVLAFALAPAGVEATTSPVVQPATTLEFADQPPTYASSLVTSSGGYVYDWQLANMFDMWIGEAGYANLVFVFNQCYAGGMMDELGEQLDGDVAMLGAAAHDDVSSGLGDNYDPQRYPSWQEQYGFDRPEDFYAKEVGEELAKTGDDAPTMRELAETAETENYDGPQGPDAKNGEDFEQPQTRFLGRGGDVKIGKTADGSDVQSRHAILFAGDADGMRHWNDVDRAYKALTEQQGFAADDVQVLVGGGKDSTRPDGSPAPDYIDGAGTKQELFDAIESVSAEMNENEQLIFWASDHGNRERTERALDRAVRDPVKQTVPPRHTASRGSDNWDLDEAFLGDMSRDPDNQPYVSLVIEPEDLRDSTEEVEFWLDVSVFVDDRELRVERVEPVVALDADPDLDGFEVVAPVPESLLESENRIDVGWRGDPEAFRPYVVHTLQISTGGIAQVPVTPTAEEETLALVDVGVDRYNRVADRGAVPGVLATLASGERINAEVTRADGERTTVGIETGPGARVVAVHDEPFERPTLIAWADEATVRRITASDDMVGTTVDAINAGDIGYRDVGFFGAVTSFLSKLALRVYALFG